MPVHKLTLTGAPACIRRIWDQIRKEHAGIIVESSWTIAEVGEVLEFNTTDWRMIMNTPLVMLTHLQADLELVPDLVESPGSAPMPPSPRRSGSERMAAGV